MAIEERPGIVAILLCRCGGADCETEGDEAKGGDEAKIAAKMGRGGAAIGDGESVVARNRLDQEDLGRCYRDATEEMLPLAACHLPLVACRLPPAACHLPLPLATCRYCLPLAAAAAAATTAAQTATATDTDACRCR